ncbi:hypothetical protein POM88_051924 [Heracleum sosnowskyi]|uniref:RNase H type-1 domain-containing protein n=1 Tax=Heracleum sosnowskyi TaxID=360622 RepID=A0AAD8GS82_9APIA|nr:hypothetical protein POM88_051924 [Heracleum sosnowskyi]
MVCEIFSEEEGVTIMNIPRSTSWPMDRMYWWPSKDGKYSVLTGYWQGRLGQAPTSSIAERLMWVANKADKNELRLFSCFMWAAWSCRNSAVFEKNPPKSIQVNTDAHVGNEPCPYVGLGVVIRDDRGVVLGIASRKKKVKRSADVAAADFGFKLAMRMGYRKVVLESDAMNEKWYWRLMQVIMNVAAEEYKKTVSRKQHGAALDTSIYRKESKSY